MEIGAKLENQSGLPRRTTVKAPSQVYPILSGGLLFDIRCVLWEKKHVW